jgi:hypothetical protein
VWDSAAVGTYLKVLDLSAHGRYYPLLMAGNSEFFVTHIQHADDEYVGRTTHECSYQYFYQAQDANYTGPSSGEIQDFSWMLGTACIPERLTHKIPINTGLATSYTGTPGITG